MTSAVGHLALAEPAAEQAQHLHLALAQPGRPGALGERPPLPGGMEHGAGRGAVEAARRHLGPDLHGGVTGWAGRPVGAGLGHGLVGVGGGEEARGPGRAAAAAPRW